MKYHPSIIFKTQHGSILVVSMLVLFVMTIIGLTTMSTNFMSQKMATNSQDIAITFQAAESAIGRCKADASPVDSTFFRDILDGDADDIPLDFTKASATGNCTATYLNKAHHINSSMDLFTAHTVEFTGTGEIPATNGKTVSVNGFFKGPFPKP